MFGKKKKNKYEEVVEEGRDEFRVMTDINKITRNSHQNIKKGPDNRK